MNPLMNMSSEQPEMEEEEMMSQSPMMGEEEDDGVDDEEYAADVVANLEQHLDSLPDDQKEFLYEYVSTPEGATLMGIVGGKEIYDYFAKLVDPNKSLTVTQTKAQPNTSAGGGLMNPQQGAAPMQPEAQAQPSQQAPAQAPQGALMQM